MKIPLFPLPSIVLPGGTLPLRLFEPRYLRMVSECFRNGTGFGSCLSRPSSGQGPVKPFPIGTLVSIVDFDQGSDGMLHITAKGEQEYKLIDITVEKDSLLIGEIELQERPVKIAMPPQYSSLAVKLSQILQHIEPHMSYPDRDLDDAEWVCNRLLELLPIAPAEKYQMLRDFDIHARLEALDALSFSVAEQ